MFPQLHIMPACLSMPGPKIHLTPEGELVGLGLGKSTPPPCRYTVGCIFAQPKAGPNFVFFCAAFFFFEEFMCFVPCLEAGGSPLLWMTHNPPKGLYLGCFVQSDRYQEVGGVCSLQQIFCATGSGGSPAGPISSQKLPDPLPSPELKGEQGESYSILRVPSAIPLGAPHPLHRSASLLATTLPSSPPPHVVAWAPRYVCVHCRHLPGPAAL